MDIWRIVNFLFVPDRSAIITDKVVDTDPRDERWAQARGRTRGLLQLPLASLGAPSRQPPGHKPTCVEKKKLLLRQLANLSAKAFVPCVVSRISRVWKRVQRADASPFGPFLRNISTQSNPWSTPKLSSFSRCHSSHENSAGPVPADLGANLASCTIIQRNVTQCRTRLSDVID
jgi:hypothetical protein